MKENESYWELDMGFWKHMLMGTNGGCDDHYDRMSFVYFRSCNCSGNIGWRSIQFSAFHRMWINKLSTQIRAGKSICLCFGSYAAFSLNSWNSFEISVSVHMLQPSLLVDDCTVIASHIVLVHHGRNHDHHEEEEGLDSLIRTQACF